MKVRGRRGGDAGVFSPELVPLPDQVRKPVKLQYVGLLRELTKSLDASVQAVSIDEKTQASMVHSLCDCMVRRLSCLWLIATIFEAGFESANEQLRSTRNRLAKLARESDAIFSGTALRLAVFEEFGQHVERARQASARAEGLTLQGLDSPESMGPEHALMTFGWMRRASQELARALGLLGWRREGQALERLCGQIQPVIASSSHGPGKDPRATSQRSAR